MFYSLDKYQKIDIYIYIYVVPIANNIEFGNVAPYPATNREQDGWTDSDSTSVCLPNCIN